MNVRTLYRRCPQALLRSPLGLACPYVSWVLNEARLSSFSEEGRPNDCGGTDLQANLRSPAAISSNIASPSWERAEGRANVPIGAVREKNFEEKGWKLRVAEAREFVWEKLAVLIDFLGCTRQPCSPLSTPRREKAGEEEFFRSESWLDVFY